MIYKGRIAIVGGTGDPLPVNCEVTDNRLVITTGDGSVIGDWGTEEIAIERSGDLFVISAEGERLRLTVSDPNAFAESIPFTTRASVAERMDAARDEPPPGSRRIGLMAVAAVAFFFGVAAVVAVLVVLSRSDDQSTQAVSVSTTTSTTVRPTTTTPVTRWVEFHVDVYDYFDWVEGENHEGDTCLAVDDFHIVRSGVNIFVRDAETQEIVASGALEPGQLWIEPGMESLDDDELDLFWKCLFVAPLEVSSIRQDRVYEAGIETLRHTFTGRELLDDEGGITFFDVDYESARELIRIGG